jgi:hypothetical protein
LSKGDAGQAQNQDCRYDDALNFHLLISTNELLLQVQISHPGSSAIDNRSNVRQTYSPAASS